MNKIVGLGLVAAAVVVALVIGAQLIGAPLGTVGSRLHYATRQLRSALVADAQPTAREVAQ